MIAKAMPGLLPPLSPEDALEVTTVHSAAGIPLPPGGLVTEAPFRAPHHTSSSVSLVGGGTRSMRPGEISALTRRCPVPGRTGRVPGERARRPPTATRGGRRAGCAGPTGRPRSRRDSCSSEPPIRAPAARRPRIAATVVAALQRRVPSTCGGCRGRCWTGSTSGSTSSDRQRPTCSGPRRANPATRWRPASVRLGSSLPNEGGRGRMSVSRRGRPMSWPPSRTARKVCSFGRSTRDG